MKTTKNTTQQIVTRDDKASQNRSLRPYLERATCHLFLEKNDTTPVTAGVFLAHLIPLDVMMPGITGGELAASFHANLNLKDVPVVSLTAAVTNERMNADSGQFGDSYFPAQPVGLTEVRSCLRHHQGESHAVRQTRPWPFEILV